MKREVKKVYDDLLCFIERIEWKYTKFKTVADVQRNKL